MDAGSSFGASLFERLLSCALIEARTGRSLAGPELRQAVLRAARGLRDSSTDPARPVLLVLDGSLDATLVYLGALVAGRLFVPVDQREWKRRGAEVMERCSPDLLWVPSGIGVEASAVRVARGLPGLDAHLCTDPGAAGIPGEFVDPDVIAWMLTSGSTGAPVLVQVSSENLITNTVDIVRTQGLDATDRALLCLSLSYCFGASVLHSHLWAGGSVVVDDRLMLAEKVLDSIERHACTSFAGVPTTYLFLSRHSTVLTRPLPSMRRWLQAGGLLEPSAVALFRDAFPGARFLVMYGQTEATARITTMVSTGGEPPGCVGFPMPTLSVEVREGELWVSGPSVSRGYSNDPERTREKFSDGWLRTGDDAELLPDGRVCIHGRRDAFVKIRGHRVGAEEIEATVRRLTGCVVCCAVPLPDPMSGEVIGLWIEPGTVDRDVVLAKLAGLPKYWDVGTVITEAGLPLTVSGKPDRRSVLQRLQRIRD